MGQWHVILNDRILQRFWVEEGDTVRIGRGHMVDVDLDNTAISRQHGSIEMRNGKYFLAHYAGWTTTTLNGRKICGEQELHRGDTIGIGGVQLRFSWSCAANRTRHCGCAESLNSSPLRMESPSLGVRGG